MEENELRGGTLKKKTDTGAIIALAVIGAILLAVLIVSAKEAGLI